MYQLQFWHSVRRRRLRIFNNVTETLRHIVEYAESFSDYARDSYLEQMCSSIFATSTTPDHRSTRPDDIVLPVDSSCSDVSVVFIVHQTPRKRIAGIDDLTSTQNHNSQLIRSDGYWKTTEGHTLQTRATNGTTSRAFCSGMFGLSRLLLVCGVCGR